MTASINYTSKKFIRDWVVDVGIWFVQSSVINNLLTCMIHRAFTLSWLFPVSLFVGLVSIQNISAYWPSLVKTFQIVSIDQRCDVARTG